MCMTLRNKQTWKLIRATRFALTPNESQEDPRVSAEDVAEPRRNPGRWIFGFTSRAAGGRLSFSFILSLSLSLSLSRRKCAEGARDGGLRDAERRRATPSDVQRADAHGWTRAGNAITVTLIYSIIAEATPSKCRHASLDPNHSRPSSRLRKERYRRDMRKAEIREINDN